MSPNFLALITSENWKVLPCLLANLWTLPAVVNEMQYEIPDFQVHKREDELEEVGQVVKTYVYHILDS